MYIMNLIHEICLTKNNISNIPKWKIITKNKQEKKLNKDISEFKNSDIFSASENIISFLLSLDKEITNHITGFLYYTDTYLHIEVLDINEVITDVVYFPNSNRFEIGNKNVGYTIYRNNKICNRIDKMWEPLTVKIKERYLDIIIQMAEYIASISFNK